MIIINYVFIILICFGLSFFAKGLIDKFCREDELKEEFFKQNEEKLSLASKNEKKEIEKKANTIKVKFCLKFSFPVFLILGNGPVC